MTVDAQPVVKFTPIQQRILAVLNDGNTHSREELLLAIDPDGLADPNTLNQHIFHLRRKLRPMGHDLAVEKGSKGTHGPSTYRRIRLYTPEDRQ